MKIVKMQEDYRDAVFSMMRRFYDSPAVRYPADDEILRKDIEDCIGPLPFVTGYVFLEEEDVIGYAVTASGYSTEFGGICIWIEDLYLEPEFWGRGYAGMFFRFLEKRQPAVRYRLEVEKENEAAVKAYRKHGFCPVPYLEMDRQVASYAEAD